MLKRPFLPFLAGIVLAAFAMACTLRAAESGGVSVATPALAEHPTRNADEGAANSTPPAPLRPAPTPAPARMPTSEPLLTRDMDTRDAPTATGKQAPAITVSEPRPGQLVTNPLHLEGTARVFEATVEFELVADGEVRGRGFTTASAGAPERGSYAADLQYQPVESDMDALLRVFWSSPADGSVQGLVTVPVRLQAASPPLSETPSANAPG